MAYTEFLGTPASLLESLTARTVRGFAKYRASYIAARKRRAAIAELHALDDYTLKDIGLHRSEIERAVVERTPHDLE
jgi:uncharacterized protein YjiS (DUF1127 family)